MYRAADESIVIAIISQFARVHFSSAVSVPVKIESSVTEGHAY